MADINAGSESPNLLSTHWAELSIHKHWLVAEGQRLLEHYAKARVPLGFATLGNDGNMVDDTAKTIITARMVHCYALATLMGIPGSAALADHGLDALLDGPLRDHTYDGWFSDASSAHDHSSRKKAYVHAFIALAGASASIAGRPRGTELMQAAIAVIDQHFWLEDEDSMLPSFAADWSDPEDYRGANCNMHTTEACLALADATGEIRWLERALSLAKRFGHDIPATYHGRLPEHFDGQWNLLPDYNADMPFDDLRPWGLTPGHFIEWAGLLLKVESACQVRGRSAPDWLLSDAITLFDNAISRGWAADGKSGMVYTISWEDEISVPNRPYWVQAEMANTALMLARRTGQSRFEHYYRLAWDYIASVLIDREAGGWRHEVDADGHLSTVVYPTREDLYHDFQATITPLIPTAASLAGGLRTHVLNAQW
ncbi:AGE family epimerase/isomerase [Psychrobacter sp. B38]|uniref:AGE family epimerase/isomerase n=1 Tax=Psychrobacter sp. B38 TaxID=3143538 RepID=UPI00320D11F9